MRGNLGMLLDRKVPLVVKSLEKVPFEHTFHGTVDFLLTQPGGPASLYKAK